jgi:hypothetical protein
MRKLELLRDREGTENISSDQIENAAPSSSSNCSGGILPLRVRDSAEVARSVGSRSDSLLVVLVLLAGGAIVGCWRLNCIRFLPLGKPVHKNALEGLRACRSDISLIGNLLLCSSNGGIVDVLLEGDAWVVTCMEKLSLNGLIVSECDVGRIAGIVALKCKSCVVHLGVLDRGSTAGSLWEV